MKILIKLPTRSRPQKFFNLLNTCIQKLSNENTYHILVSCDVDDPSMCNEIIKNRLKSYKNLSYYYSIRDSKIGACNRDIDKVDDWDVVILISDDMMIIVDHWDKYISDGFMEYFPDTDGVLWLFDGHRDDINTLCILGREYYKRFGYIYYPGYQSFYSDNEFTKVANDLGKQIKYKWPKVIIEHQHYSNNNEFLNRPKQQRKSDPLFGADKLYKENRPAWENDYRLFESRKREKKI